MGLCRLCLLFRPGQSSKRGVEHGLVIGEEESVWFTTEASCVANVRLVRGDEGVEAQGRHFRSYRPESFTHFWRVKLVDVGHE